MATLEPYPPPPPRAPVATRSSGKAVASMVLGICGLVLGFLFVPIICCVLAIVFGSLALQDISAEGGRLRGHGQAVAGLVLGIVGLAGWALVIVVLALSGGV